MHGPLSQLAAYEVRLPLGLKLGADFQLTGGHGNGAQDK